MEGMTAKLARVRRTGLAQEQNIFGGPATILGMIGQSVNHGQAASAFALVSRKRWPDAWPFKARGVIGDLQGYLSCTAGYLDVHGLLPLRSAGVLDCIVAG